MAWEEYFKGPQHKANMARSQAQLQALQVKHDDQEANANEFGMLASVQAQIAMSQSELVSMLPLRSSIAKAFGWPCQWSPYKSSTGLL